MNRWVNVFFGLRLRYILATFIFLIAILITAGYFSVKAGKQATLDSLIQQGRALSAVLVASASNIIEADRQITDVAINELLARISLLSGDTETKTPQEIAENLSSQLDLLRAIILDVDGQEILEQSSEPRGITEELDSLQELFFSKVQLNESFDIIYDFYRVQNRRLLFGIVPHPDSQYIFIIYPWTIGQYANRRLSLAYLLNQISREVGIEYIMLQNPDGIVFASKQVYQTDRIEDDPFLVEALASDSALFRVVEFQDREVLEVVHNFESGDRYSGLFRVGLSLFGYRQLVANFQRQVWFLVAILVILSLVGLAIVVGYQNLNIMENALNRARAISQSLHDSVAGIVLSTDENLKITSANIVARRYFGLPDGAPKDWEYDRYFSDDPFQVKAVLEDKRPRNFETQMKSGTGTMDLLVFSSSLINDKGEPAGVIVVAQDISEKKALEKKAHQAHRLSELGTVAAGLAHDIRNPLNAIGMVIQRLEQEVTVTEGENEFKDFIGTLKSEVKKLNEIIEKILQVARSSRLELKEINTKPEIERVISLYRHEAAARNIKISAFLEEIKTFINEVAFKDIISNLIKNAIEAIGENGNIMINSTQKKDSLVVTVDDDGPGMTREQESMLFKPFYTTKPGGTGLGLATAYKSATDHGGDLKAESKPGGPTRFILTIPLKR